MNHDAYARALREYIAQKAPTALKQPNTCLPHPFVDPGSIYNGNLWDWDSFWSVYALINLAGPGEGEETPLHALRERILHHAKGNIHNFFAFQLPDGYIPMMIEECDLPEPYLIGKHKEGAVLNMMKPFLCQQAALISGDCGDFEWLRGYLDGFARYFGCYDRHYFQANSGLYAWADDVMIGMDNDPASFGRPRFSTANIFLNSFMVRELRSMARILEALGQAEAAVSYRARAEALVNAITAECWDPRDRFFYSVDIDIRTRSYDWFHVGLGVFWKTLPIKIRAWSGFLPMWAGFATPEQAEALVAHLRDTGTFACDWGIRSLSRDEKMYNLEATNNPSNWLGPIWLIVNYAVFRGLMNYGYREDAARILDQTLHLLGRDLERTGTLHEYYVPETGEPVMNGGFLNWNMLVLNMVDEWNGKPTLDALLG